LGHQTCKNRRPYNLYCVGADVKPCSINYSNWSLMLPLTVNYHWHCCDVLRALVDHFSCNWCRCWRGILVCGVCTNHHHGDHAFTLSICSGLQRTTLLRLKLTVYNVILQNLCYLRSFLTCKKRDRIIVISSVVYYLLRNSHANSDLILSLLSRAL